MYKLRDHCITYDDIYQSNPPLQFISESAEFQFNNITITKLRSDISKLLNRLQVVYRETNDGDGRNATPSTTVAQLKESENNVDVVKMMQQAPLWHNQERKKQMWRGTIKPNTLV